VKIAFLELIDDNIGPKGATALGASLSVGQNLSLLTLNLDYNATLGSDGQNSPSFRSCKYGIMVMILCRRSSSVPRSTNKRHPEAAPPVLRADGLLGGSCFG
jgi:hypothetical protein